MRIPMLCTLHVHQTRVKSILVSDHILIVKDIIVQQYCWSFLHFFTYWFRKQHYKNAHSTNNVELQRARYADIHVHILAEYSYSKTLTSSNGSVTWINVISYQHKHCTCWTNAENKLIVQEKTKRHKACENFSKYKIRIVWGQACHSHIY